MFMCEVFNELPADYVMDSVVITEAGAAEIDEFNASEFGIDPFLDVELREDYYGDERRVPAWLITHEGCFVAAVVELTDYALLSR